MRVHTLPQRSAEWYRLRSGLLTASRAADMLSKVKSGEAAARRDLRLQLAVERITGVPQENGFVNEHMQRGIELEGAAVQAYEALTGELVDRSVGFVAHDTLTAGCSPDGLVGTWEGAIEVKVPKSTTHYRYLRDGVVPPEYVPQCLHLTWICAVPWVDFVSYDPRFPADLQLFVARYVPGRGDVTSYELAVSLFLSEVEREVAELSGLRQEVV